MASRLLALSDGWFAIVGAAVGGLATGLAGWLTNRSAERRELLRLDHERKLAREARRQERMERAYLRLLHAVNAAGQLIETDTIDKDAPDYGASNEELDAVWTELDAFGSEEVRTAFNAWRASRFLFKLDMINARKRDHGVARREDVEHRELIRNRKDALEAAGTIRERIAAELHGDA